MDASRARLRSLYICYLSLEDPLTATQVVAYLEGLVGRGHAVHLLTFEQRLTRGQRREWRRRLARRGIAWHRLRYHRRPSLPATAWDTVCGIGLGLWLLTRHRLQAVHARSHVPAMAGLVLCRLTRRRLIFDIRGLLAEEYVDSGNWRAGSLPVRIVKRVERAAIRRADGIVVLTHSVSDLLFGPGGDERVHVIPCCADNHRLSAGLGHRDRVRASLGVEDRTVLIYVGKLTGWYMTAEMVRFAAVAAVAREDVHLLVLTQEDQRPLDAAIEAGGLGRDRVTATRVQPEEMGDYLAAADAAISFVRPTPSKISSSPTKIGEYLAAGLPIACSAGIGDLDEMMRRHRAGVLVSRFDDESLARAANALFAMVDDPATAGRLRAAAHEELDLETVGIERYDQLYRAVSARALTSPRAAGTPRG